MRMKSRFHCFNLTLCVQQHPEVYILTTTKFRQTDRSTSVRFENWIQTATIIPCPIPRSLLQAWSPRMCPNNRNDSYKKWVSSDTLKQKTTAWMRAVDLVCFNEKPRNHLTTHAISYYTCMCVSARFYMCVSLIKS